MEKQNYVEGKKNNNKIATASQLKIVCAGREKKNILSRRRVEDTIGRQVDWADVAIGRITYNSFTRWRVAYSKAINACAVAVKHKNKKPIEPQMRALRPFVHLSPNDISILR